MYKHKVIINVRNGKGEGEDIDRQVGIAYHGGNPSLVFLERCQNCVSHPRVHRTTERRMHRSPSPIGWERGQG